METITNLIGWIAGLVLAVFFIALFAVSLADPTTLLVLGVGVAMVATLLWMNRR